MPNIAVLIDAENVDPAYARQIFRCAGELGTVVEREIYGAGIALNEWSDPILQYAIHMNMTLKPIRFKNSSDIALAVGAMDLLAARRLAPYVRSERAGELADTVLIASSDCDFSLLSVRLRMGGVAVVGMGDPKHVNPTWPAACTRFIPFEPVENEEREKKETGKRETKPKDARQKEPKPPEPKPQEAKPQEPKPPEPKPPEPKPPEPKPQEPMPPEPKAPEPRKQTRGEGEFAPTHLARVENVKAFLREQFSLNNGKMQSGSLFALLNNNADYVFDQQHSNRGPLDYLTRQYADVLRVEKGKRGQIVFHAVPPKTAPAAPPDAPEAVSETPPDAAPEAVMETPPDAAPEAVMETPPEALAEAVPEAVPEAAPEALAEAAPENTVETAPDAAEEDGDEAAPEAPAGDREDLAAYLAAGIPEEAAPRVQAISAAHQNLRTIYNKLRKEFGSGEGRSYYQIVRELRKSANA